VTTPLLPPVKLRCAYQVNPLGVAPDRVRLSWQAGLSQRAYQLRVAPGERELASGDGLCWDSGRVESRECSDVPYRGSAVEPGARYAWAVRVWDESDTAPDGTCDGTGEPSPWSESAWFEVELDQADGWQAAWIGLGRIRTEVKPPSADGPCDGVAKALAPVPYLRREFEVAAAVSSARLYVTALGLYEARLNGRRVGDGVLTPGWTDYHQRIQYQTYDVTDLIRGGVNVLGAMIADGWHSGFVGFDAKRAGAMYGDAPEFLAQLVITLADGSRQVVATDERWRSSFGAIKHGDLLMGERHDLADEPAGWDTPGFDSNGWAAVRCRPRDGVKLVADPGPQVRAVQELPAISVMADADGRYVVDFGQNLSGWVRISYPGPERAQLAIRHAEVLNPDGSLYTDNLRSARQTDEYLTPGGPVVLEPRFTLHGFRYAEISGWPGPLDPAALTALVVHSDAPETGSFASSLAWLDQLFANINWGQRGNFISVPTDCPQRDERLGWLGDAQIFARTASYNRDVAAFFSKWLDDVADGQLPSGAFPDIAPRINLDWGGAPGWGDAGVIIPWTLHRMFADRGSLERHYGAMTAWMDFIERGNPDFVRCRELGNSYNDWLAPGDDLTPPELLATAYWAYDAVLMAQIAATLGRAHDAAAYQTLRNKIGAAFADTFIGADGSIESGTQTSYVLGLHMNLVPADLRAATAQHLVAAIEKEDWRLTTGFAGVGYLLPVLSSTGYTEVAYRLLGQDALPSWRYMIDHGATTIWERWDGWSADRGFQSAWMNSFNHYALGSVGEWLYRFVLGLELAPGAVGFDRLAMRPHPGGELTWARGSFESVRGRIAAGWRVEDGTLSYRIELPPGVSASVHLPGARPDQFSDENGRGPVRVCDFPGTLGAHEAVFETGPGSHEFTGAALQESPCLT
jgi:alpha-L-rhamnosidase